MDVTDWIRDWIWKKSATWRSSNPTILAFDKEHPDRLLGYGTWKHVEARSSAGVEEMHIEIAWFGIHRDYQGMKADTGERCSVRVYATVLAHALADDDSTDDMPVTLTCHLDNDRGYKFWQSLGFSDAAEAEERLPDGQPQKYRRMVLGSRHP